MADEQQAAKQGAEAPDGDQESTGNGTADSQVATSKDPNDKQRALDILRSWELARGDDGGLYARLDGDVLRLDDNERALRSYLADAFYRDTGRAPRRQSLDDVVEVALGQARRSKVLPVCRRVADYRGGVALDLGAGKPAIHITKKGWRRMRKPSNLLLLRAPEDKALPYPLKTGTVDPLLEFLSEHFPRLGADALILIIAWLFGCLSPHAERPILALYGQQGSGKTTLARFLRSLIDPSGTDGRQLDPIPDNPRDWLPMVANRYLIAFDNASSIPPWLSDCWARIATGDRVVGRKLYTTSELVTVIGSRPLLINGIPKLLTRGDVVDRAIVIQMPGLADGHRKTPAALFNAFRKHHGCVLGGLCRAAQTALENSHLRLKQTPRMASFAQWVVAGEGALPWGPNRFLEAYQGNRLEAVGAVLDASPVAGPLLAWIEAQEKLPRTVTSTALYDELSKRRQGSAVKSDWPQGVAKMSEEIGRIIEQFEVAYGYLLEARHTRRANTWTVSRRPRRPSA